MTYHATLKDKRSTMPDGKTRLDLWIDDVAGFADDGLILMRDRAGLVDDWPAYASVCSPVNLVEYPLGAPEGPRGYFRCGKASLVYPSDRAASAALGKLRDRVAAVCWTMEGVMDESKWRVSARQAGGETLAITMSGGSAWAAYLRLEATAPCFLMRKSPSMGALCLGVCTPAEYKAVGTMAGAEAGWRVGKAEFLTYPGLVNDIIEDTLAGMVSLPLPPRHTP